MLTDLTVQIYNVLWARTYICAVITAIAAARAEYVWEGKEKEREWVLSMISL